MGKMGKKLFNLAAIITSLYRDYYGNDITSSLRNNESYTKGVILRHFSFQNPFFKKSVDFQRNEIFEKNVT